MLPSVIGESYDGTTDGSYNYIVDYQFGIVYRTNRDYTNPVALFSPQYSGWAVTYDATNNSLWVSDEAYGVVDDFSLSGTLLSSFNTGHMFGAALALDPADETLWLVNDDGHSTDYGYLEQYSKAGALLSIGPYVGQTWGGEFNEPEPSSFALLCSGVGILFWQYRLRRG
jgi:hypothetical protein